MADPKPLLNIKSLKEQVYEYLREQMRTGGLRPGSAIDMEETSRRLGVSETPLRDALLQLEMEGFVTILPRRKIVVNALTLRDIRDFYEIIGALESAALRAAFARLGADEVRPHGGAQRRDEGGHRARRFRPLLREEPGFPRRLPRPLGERVPEEDGHPAEEAPVRLSPAPGVRQGMGAGLDRRARRPVWP